MAPSVEQSHPSHLRGSHADPAFLIHKARNVIERLPKPLHASVRRALRQAWELDDADKAERLLRNLARRLDQEAPGVAASILEGLDEMLTVNRLGLPASLRRSLACTNSIENMMGTVRRVCRNVKRWQNAAMALRWTAAGMLEAAKGFRGLKASNFCRFSELHLRLINPSTSPDQLKTTQTPHSIIHRNACFAYFNKIWGIPNGPNRNCPMDHDKGFASGHLSMIWIIRGERMRRRSNIR